MDSFVAAALGFTGRVVLTVGAGVAAARQAGLVGEPPAVRLEGARAAHQGAGRRDERAAARLRRDPVRGADHRGRAAAHPGPDGAGDQGPGRRPVRLGRLHLGQRGPRGLGEVRRARPGRPRTSAASRSPASARRPPTRCARSASSPSWCPSGEQSSRGPAGRVLAARRGARPGRPGAAAARRHRHRDAGRRPASSAAGRSTTSPRTGRCGPRRRRPRSATRSSPAASTRCCFTSSSTVRNLVGIAGKPHARTVVAVHRPEDRRDRGRVRPAGRRPAAARRRCRTWSRRSPRTRSSCARSWPRCRPSSAAARRCRARPRCASAEVRPWRRGRCRIPSVRPRRLRRTAGAAPAASRRRAVAPGRAGAADVRQGGADRAARRSRRCPASCSTPASRCARPRPRRSRPASAG